MKVLEFGTGIVSSLGGSSNNTGRATLFLHGFPGVRSKQNRDLAEATAARFRRKCFVPLYDGLGEADGVFSFLNCRDQVRSLAQELVTTYKLIDVVGHSWGGYLALGLASEYQEKIGSLILMSPLLYFFTLDLSQQAFKLIGENNLALALGSTDDLASEFYTLGSTERAEDFAKQISPTTKVSIFQAANDDTTPVSYAENLVNQFQVRPHYEAVATDHSFLVNRGRALERVMTVLA